jgi:hypothetical protein
VISMLSSSQVKHCHVAHGQGYSQGNCVTRVWWGGGEEGGGRGS